MQAHLSRQFQVFVQETAQLNAAMHQRVVAGAYQADIPEKYRDLTMKSFVDLAGDDPGKRGAIRAARQYAESGTVADTDGATKNSLLLWGAPGVGKTGLLTPVFKRLATGKTNLWISLLALANQVRGGYNDNTAYEKIRIAGQVDILFLDDVGSLGREQATPGMIEILEAIIWERHNKRRPTLMTSNRGPDALGGYFTEAIYQRIAEMALVVEMAGRVLRSV